MIKLTASAITHFKSTLQSKPEALGIKLGVKKSGCSGYAYVLDMANIAVEASGEYDKLVIDGLEVFIDKDSQEFLDGTEVDYMKDKFSGSIKFRNPNVVGECGCGESFSIKKKS